MTRKHFWWKITPRGVLRVRGAYFRKKITPRSEKSPGCWALFFVPGAPTGQRYELVFVLVARSTEMLLSIDGKVFNTWKMILRSVYDGNNDINSNTNVAGMN